MKVTISLEIPLTILFQEKSEKIVSQEVQLRMLYAERKQRQKEKEDWEKKLKENRREFLDVKTNLQVQWYSAIIPFASYIFGIVVMEASCQLYFFSTSKSARAARSSEFAKGV